MNSQNIRNLQEAYMEVYQNLDERVLGQDPESRKEDSKERKSGSKRLPPSSGEKYAKTQSQLISYMDKLTKNKKIIPGMSNEEVEEFDEGMDMKDFKANRRNIERKEASDDARKRGHVGKTWVDGGRTYSPDEAKSRRANMTDAKRQALYRIANDPDDDSPDDDHYPASKTTNPKKLRKQRVMGEIGESYDLYDVILEYLLDEGYAETPEAAESDYGKYE